MKTMLYKQANATDKKAANIWGRRVVTCVCTCEESLAKAKADGWVDSPMDIKKQTTDEFMKQIHDEAKKSKPETSEPEKATLDEVDTDGDGYPSLAELRAAGVEAGIENAENMRRKTLIKELGL